MRTPYVVITILARRTTEASLRSTPPSIAASRDGDFDAVAGHTATYAKLYPFVTPALVNGAAGAVVAPGGTLGQANSSRRWSLRNVPPGSS